MNSASEFLGKYWRIIVVIVGVILLFEIIYALRTAVAPFLAGLALVYVMMPMVTWIETRFPCNRWWFNTGRISAIAIVYALFVLVLGVLSFFVISTIVNSIHSLTHNSVQYFTAASDTLKQWTENLRQTTPPEIRGQIDTYVQDMGKSLLNAVHMSIMNGMEALPSTLGLIMGLAGVPFFLFYVLKDREKLSSFHSSLPGWARPHVQNILLIIEDAFGKYIRSSLMAGLIVGVLALIGLLILQVPLAPLLAILAGVTEIIPVVGPWIGGIVAVLVALALAPDKAIWVGVLFLSIQIIENVFLVPRIQAAYFQIHPAVTMVLLVVAAYIAGLWGIILVFPMTATAVGIYKYCCQVAQEQSKSGENLATAQTNKT